MRGAWHAMVLLAGATGAGQRHAAAGDASAEPGAGDRGLPRSGYVIHTTLMFEDDSEYNSGMNGNAWSGRGAFGHAFDLQIAEDFETDALRHLTSVTGAYETILGRVPTGGLQVDVWTSTASGPGTLVASQTGPVNAVSSWSRTHFGYVGLRLSVDVDILLEARTRYFIMIQPIDLTEDGDWYYQIRDEMYGDKWADAHARDGGRADGGYGVTEWTAMVDLGYERGDAGMEIRGLNPDCLADCNGDGSADTRDVTRFLYLWNRRDPAADCNGDAVINTMDMVCYLDAWSGGCGG